MYQINILTSFDVTSIFIFFHLHVVSRMWQGRGSLVVRHWAFRRILKNSTTRCASTPEQRNENIKYLFSSKRNCLCLCATSEDEKKCEKIYYIGSKKSQNASFYQVLQMHIAVGCVNSTWSYEI